MALDTNKITKGLEEFLASPEGQKSVKDYFDKINNKKIIEKSQLERFHAKYADRFAEIFEKVIEKYESDKYINSWYKRGFEPPTNLYFFFLEYAELYGREATKKEWKKYGNYFTTCLFFINGYYIQLMQGQGSCVRIDKENLKK